MTKKIVKRTDANNETLYFYTHSDAVDVGDGSGIKSLTEVIDDTLHKSPQTLTNAEKTQVHTNLGTESFVGDRAVRYDESQVLGSDEKAQALTNLGLNGVDEYPTKNSTNMVRSGGVQNELALAGVYDVTAHNSNATFASLSALLSDANLNTLIPTTVRKGGMSIKFVQSSDNNYMQFRCIADEFTTDVTQWAICDDEILVDAPAYIKAETDANGLLLFWIKSDGSIDWAIGVPAPVKAYVDSCIAEILNGNEGTDIDGLNKVIAFLDDFSTSDTLAALLNTKVDKEEGKGLIQDEVAESLSIVEEPEFMDVELDSGGKVLSGRKANGNKFENMPIETPAAITSSTYDPEGRIELKIDNGGKIISYRKRDGTLVEDSVDIRYALIKEASIGNIDEIVTDVINNNLFLPTFYHNNNYIDDIVLKVQRIILQMGRGDIFGFITDTHPMNNYNIRSGKIFKYIASKTPLQKVLFGGDIGPSDATSYGAGTSALDGLAKSIIQQTERLYAPCREADLSVYIARGNHDFASSKDKGATTFDENGYIATREATRHMVLAYSDGAVYDESNPKSNYYYVDNKAQKIRYIVVDTSDSVDSYYPREGANSNVTMATSDTQIKWIIEQAILTIPSGYSIIFMGHVVPSAVAYGAPESPSHPWNKPSIYRINDIITAIQNKSSITLTLNEESETYDFSSSDFNVIAFLGGHQHYDSQTIEHGVLYYVSSGDFISNEGTTSRVEMQLFNIGLKQRVENSITEDTTNIIVVDVDKLKIDLMRIGSGVNKRFNLSPITVSTGNTITLNSTLSGSLRWNSYDALILGNTNDNMFSHTVTSVDADSGVVTGLTAGESVVVVYSETDNTIEFFNIKVQ